MADQDWTTLTLDELRQEIDKIDEEIHNLLLRRTEVVTVLGEAKRRSEDENTPLSNRMRPGREAIVLRQLIKRHNGDIPYDSITGIWRSIVSTFLRLQFPFEVSVYDAADAVYYRDLARVHFGAGTPLHAGGNTAMILGKVATQDLSVGLLPAPGIDADSRWWLDLPDDGQIQVVMRLPFLCRNEAEAEERPAFIIAKTDREDSGDDASWIRITGLDVDSIHSILDQTGFHYAILSQAEHTLLLEVDGYLTDNHFIVSLLKEKAKGKVSIIGGYARQIIVKE
tara:strand:- start:1569 stop:2414 length:846 start_codon:yes stop_codon:yes gene_type:complete